MFKFLRKQTMKKYFLILLLLLFPAAPSVYADGSVRVIPATGASGLTVYHLMSAASTNATNIKASAGNLHGWYIRNNATTDRKLVFHNSASTPTAGASVFFTLSIPAGSAANVFSAIGIPFSSGIGITTVTDAADNGTTAVSLNDLNINLFYK